MGGPQIITLGCRLNIAESEAIREIIGREMPNAQDDLVVVNSCAVTAEAVRQSRQAIRRARRDRPGARIMVTGCAAQTEPETFAAMAEVDAVIGNREKMHRTSYLPNGGSDPVRVSDIMSVRDTAPHMASAFAEHARAFLEVQNGCDHRCTFCIIPYGRGNSRSVPAGAVIDKARELVDVGYREIVLTGVDVTSYGPDLPGAPSLGLLIERMLKGVPDLPRLRLSSLDSVEIDERLFDILAHEPRMMPHLHLSLQAGDDMILKRMKRRHSRADAVRIVERLRAARPEISIGADIIAGFPTEDDAMFENSLRLVEQCAIVHGHVFPYSPRANTPAARMPQVERATIKARAARLRAACGAQRERWLQSLIGSTQSVLVERNGLSGHAENFAPVRFATPQSPSSIVHATITALENGALIAQEAA
ncbi:tRNA (N(6)-L-threonylcarbamoyladenosine(37)-C(2))-methylthiotransferase MtaB [Sphingobium sp. 22B]|uniref:tRNA (N(6)-L-threonylcarbamoyladenosine(37)-C(2))- methylthiotransferase MtaB n=1 Tax=unclassified Sphingobium TaxID=2611147 RepID=UPI00078542A6|nr:MULTISPECIES: tRNA (N(6)-L-threonylcarbamoyladenosine(37)-C(2))-methylthiotransferase MtaB [unclassified Sphingobium]KXU29716.1 tRNA (N(6)-L-threonylcarbamoyladenosine(37)-C(2))-methylthiotransferase MtaB [Sphingobium sp. AM]KYC33401.1 tRNA (N(6)-L-threonylcarbamoyladenosine(37)-C(2))-methylthiotransferase MtaB [Sphingobium sp. 22B]OAP32585.1 tRNA (N(6)-L-threonylcarbamoyladenosine(37)-C(2))-methylthiotransferase MtaB [Sphingobium sp. 20006FA]